MQAEYQIIDGSSKESLSSRELAAFLAKDGLLLLPMLDLITAGERAIDEVIDVRGQATANLSREERLQVVHGAVSQDAGPMVGEPPGNAVDGAASDHVFFIARSSVNASCDKYPARDSRVFVT